MHQTRKGNQWHFGLKAHLGVDADSGLAHSLTVTAANASDVSQTHALLHGEEKAVFGDAAYQGVEKRPEMAAAHGQVQFEVAAKRGQIKALPEGALKTAVLALEKVKASVRARVEHCFQIVKNLFRHRKVRYRGLAKNLAQLQTLFALANLVIAKRALLAASPA